jgi:hypothetical protein
MTWTIIIIYVIFCILVGFCGINRRLGFFGTFLVSLFVTPFVMVIILLLTAPSRDLPSNGPGK